MQQSSVLIRPLQTEKASDISERFNKVVFEVRPNATKSQIRHAVRAIFKVGVGKVWTAILPGHKKRRGQHTYKESSWKKAVVQIAKGSTIDFHAAE